MVSSPLLHALNPHTHLWHQMLEFCKSVGPNLENYEADGVRDVFLEHTAAIGTERQPNTRRGRRLLMTLSHGSRSGREINPPRQRRTRPEHSTRSGFHPYGYTLHINLRIFPNHNASSSIAFAQVSLK